MRYEVDLPDETVRTRTSYRTYTHAIVVRRGDRWQCTSFCGSAVLAEREAGTQMMLSRRRGSPHDEVRIVPVRIVDDQPRAARAQGRR